jgi:hypothetical protein
LSMRYSTILSAYSWEDDCREESEEWSSKLSLPMGRSMSWIRSGASLLLDSLEANMSWIGVALFLCLYLVPEGET